MAWRRISRVPGGGSALWSDPSVGPLLASEFFGSPVSSDVTGWLAVTEAGADSFAGQASARVAGALTLSEAGQDLVSAVLRARSTGAMAAIETGQDTGAAALVVRASGALAANEGAADTWGASASVKVRGTLSASESPDIANVSLGAPATISAHGQEVGSDSASALATVRVRGSIAVTEGAGDGATVQGFVPLRGSIQCTESSGDTFAGEAEIQTAYVLDKQHALWLYQLAMLHGLDVGRPLSVGQSTRAAGDLQQSVSESAGEVVVQTVSAPRLVRMSPTDCIAALARLHGLVESLHVNATSRWAGPLSQQFDEAGGVTTVSLQ